MSTGVPLHCLRLFTASPFWAVLAWLVLFAGWSGIDSSRVRAEFPRVIVLRDNHGELSSRWVGAVDRELLRSLTEQAGLSAKLSPSPFEEVALMADCGAQRSTSCVLAITRALDTEWLLIRELRKKQGGKVQLSLVAHDGRDALLSRRVTATLREREQADLASLLAGLVSQLYPKVPEPMQAEVRASAREQNLALQVEASPRASGRAAEETELASAPEGSGPSRRSATEGAPERSRSQRDPRSIVGWTSLGVGGALLTSALIVGAKSSSDERAYSDLQIEDAQDAQRANDLLARAEKRADYANGLFIASAATAAFGIGMLVWRGVSEKRQPPIQVAAMPGRGGGSLFIRGSLSGGSR
jgi:hypothetical protein